MVALCRCAVRRNQQLAFWVPEAEGHDDFVVSAALCNWAARAGVATPAAAMIPRPRDFDDGRYYYSDTYGEWASSSHVRASRICCQMPARRQRW